MDLVNINVYAEACYSNAKYEENISIRKDTYDKLENDLKTLDVYISELDGKHSEVKADIDFQTFLEDEIEYAYSEDLKDSGDVAYWAINEIFNKNNMNLEEEVQVVENYLNNLDLKISKTVQIRRSQLEEFERCMEKFN